MRTACQLYFLKVISLLFRPVRVIPSKIAVKIRFFGCCCSVLFCQAIRITKYFPVLHYSRLHFSRLQVRALAHVFILPSLMCLWKQLQKCFRFLVLVDLFSQLGMCTCSFSSFCCFSFLRSGILEACNKLSEECWCSFCSLVVNSSSHVLIFFPASYTAPIVFFLFSRACSQRNQYPAAGCNNMAFVGS